MCHTFFYLSFIWAAFIVGVADRRKPKWNSAGKFCYCISHTNKNGCLWVAAQSSLFTDVWGACCLHQVVEELPPVYAVQKPSKQLLSYCPPWQSVPQDHGEADTAMLLRVCHRVHAVSGTRWLAWNESFAMFATRCTSSYFKKKLV